MKYGEVFEGNESSTFRIHVDGEKNFESIDPRDTHREMTSWRAAKQMRHPSAVGKEITLFKNGELVHRINKDDRASAPIPSLEDLADPDPPDDWLKMKMLTRRARDE